PGEKKQVRLSILANQVTDRGHLCGRSGRCSFQAQLSGNRLLDNGTLEGEGVAKRGMRFLMARSTI
ncbi:MAG: hypothetical protein WAW79_03890, partial [Steroidobacteraceae bacterium]